MEDKIELEGIFEQGYGIISKSVMKMKDLHIIAKGIYSYICSYSGKGKDAFPTREHICNDLGISKDTLTKYLQELKEKGLLNVKQEKSENGKFNHNVYSVNITIPCHKITDTGDLGAVSYLTGHGEMVTNNNNINNNIYSANDFAPETPLSEKDTKADDFEKLWNIYPSKKGKAKAFSSYCNWIKGKKYMNKTMKLTNAQMWYAIKKYTKECEANNRFFQNGSTFFNNTIVEYVEFKND